MILRSKSSITSNSIENLENKNNHFTKLININMENHI